MIATLFLPQQSPQPVSIEGLVMPSPETGYARVTDQVPMLLGCAPGLEDVLACGPDYVAYSVFDHEGEINHAAMSAVADVSGVPFELNDEDSILRGPVLVVKLSN